MGLIKEPKNVDFYVDSTPLTKKEMSIIHEAIAHYYSTGEILSDKPEDKPSGQGLKARRSKRKSKLISKTEITKEVEIIRSKRYLKK